MIAIPNMEKPKNCNRCPIRIGETLGVYYDGISDEYKRVKITGCNEAKYHTNTLSEGYKMMYKDCPLIDIITCGECKYWSKLHGCMKNEDIFLITTPDDFCSYGERRE